jgi:hypothetical protein
VGCEVLTALNINHKMFWDKGLSNLIEVYDDSGKYNSIFDQEDGAVC